MSPSLRIIVIALALALAASSCQKQDEPWQLLPIGGSGGEGGSGGDDGTDLSCRAGVLLETLGKRRLLIGAAMDDEVASAARFDLRELSLAGGIPDGEGPCAVCDASCTSQEDECQNDGGGCGWWGCWQWDELEPGAQIRDFIARTKLDGQLPVITYNQFFLASGTPTYEAGIAALEQPWLLHRYFNDWRFLLQQLGDEPAFLHLEPELFGIAQRQQPDPHLLPAAVAEGNPEDCGEEESSFAGFGRCLVKMARTYAPNVKVGFHAAPWAVVDDDIFLNKDRSLDLSISANEVAAFLLACGAEETDYVVVAPADRDAGWAGLKLDEDRWWDASNTTLPNFHQAFAWGSALADALDQPILWWQIPVGNMKLPGKSRAWPDNRLDYFFDHMDEVAASQAFGVSFGPGEWKQTTPSTDGGNLIRRVEEHRENGSQPPCP